MERPREHSFTGPSACSPLICQYGCPLEACPYSEQETSALIHPCVWASQVAQVVKNLPASAGDVRDEGSIPGSGRSPGEGNGNLLQCSCLENAIDRGAWRATVHVVSEVT